LIDMLEGVGPTLDAGGSEPLDERRVAVDEFAMREQRVAVEIDAVCEGAYDVELDPGELKLIIPAQLQDDTPLRAGCAGEHGRHARDNEQGPPQHREPGNVNEETAATGHYRNPWKLLGLRTITLPPLVYYSGSPVGASGLCRAAPFPVCCCIFKQSNQGVGQTKKLS